MWKSVLPFEFAAVIAAAVILSPIAQLCTAGWFFFSTHSWHLHLRFFPLLITFHAPPSAR